MYVMSNSNYFHPKLFANILLINFNESIKYNYITIAIKVRESDRERQTETHNNEIEFNLIRYRSS